MRRLSLVAVVFALLTTYDVTRPMPTTASFGCAGSIGTRAHFAGTEEDHHNAVTGASARIEYVNEDLCTGVPIGLLSFSSAWVSVDGDDPIDVFGDDIYQIGYDDCRAGCAAGSTGNVPYYFWAYGRHASALCGDEMLPTAHFISNATAGLHLFSVFRLRVNNVDSWYAKLDGGTQAIWSDASIAGCWNGVGEVQIMNEVWDQNDQSGGPNSNRQNFESPLWHDASSWHPIVRAPASLCDFHQASTQSCQWAGDGSGKWYSWDTRWP